MRALRAPALLLPALLAAFAASGTEAGTAVLAASTGHADQAVLDRLAKVGTLPADRWRVHDGRLPHGEDPALDDSSWPEVKADYVWRTGVLWFRRVVEVPSSLGGYDPTGAILRFQFSVWGDHFIPQIIYVNGSRVAMGEDLEPIVLARGVAPGQKFLVAVKALAPPGRSRFYRATIWVDTPPERPDPRRLREEILSARALVPTIAEDRPANEKAIGDAVSAIDLAALDHGDQKAFDRSLGAAQKALAPLRKTLSRYEILAVGNSHIDMAWLWPWSETVGVVRDTFRTVLNLMDEYPDLTFAQSTAQDFAWLEEKYPWIFDEIKKRVAEGRWELVGGMWVEPDLNMPDGESLVRQLLVGKRYFQEKFGRDVRIGWNPDSFGYNWQLPQIYKKSGVDFFVTQKLDWNDTNKPTMKLFWWQSPDGSRVLTYFPHDYANEIDPVRMAKDFADARKKVPGLPVLMHLYGVGDHGGGPTRSMLDSAEQWKRPEVVYPRLVLGTAQSFFDEMMTQAPSLDLPVWNSELYLEFHRGTYTTQAETKKHNRKSEVLLLNAEKFSSLAFLAGRPYPSAPLLHAWKRVLFDQFHDIAAGSGVSAIYRDADRDYAEVRLIGDDAVRRALGALAASADTRGAGASVLVFNPLAWKRDDIVEASVQLSESGPLEVTDAAGRAVPSQLISRDPTTGAAAIRFLARGVPSLGYEVFHVAAQEGPPAVSDLAVSPMRLENAFLKVAVDPETGCITSLVDKKSGEESVAPGECADLLQAFHDLPKDWDAWNIEPDYEKETWNLDHPDRVELVERGPVTGVIRITQKFRSSTFVRDITVSAGVPFVAVRMEADWHEKHTLLKVGFPVAVSSDHATYEIPFGSIERPTTRRNSFEKAKWEVPALRWADLSDGTHGLSLMNDCKYGYDGKGHLLRLSLLRSPEWPDPNADQGRHIFTYAFYPHGGGWKAAQTVRRGYELNDPLIAVETEKHPGILGAARSFVAIEPDDVLLTALKKAEDDDGLILRFYEWAGRKADVRIRVPEGAVSAQETDLMEHPVSSLPLDGGVVTVPATPYEIQTVKITFAPGALAGEGRPK
jgi:alpha-mannosidase